MDRHRGGAIDLSSATEEELCQLGGVGPALARRLVEWREQNGGFTSVDQLAEVKGFGERKLEALRPHIVAGPHAPGPPQRFARDPALGSGPRSGRPAARRFVHSMPAEPAEQRGAWAIAAESLQPPSEAERAMGGKELREGESDSSAAIVMGSGLVRVIVVALAIASQVLVVVLLLWLT